jgi:hypothetical protein
MSQADGLLTIAILLVLIPGFVGLVAFACSEIGGRRRRSRDEASKGT